MLIFKKQNIFINCFFLFSDEEQEIESSLRLDVKLVLEYGTLLMSHCSLWQVSLCYLDQCGEEGRARQEILLSQIVSNSDIKTMKIIQAALNRGLLDVGWYFNFEEIAFNNKINVTYTFFNVLSNKYL